MKSTLALALAAAGISQVSASFLNAASYSCPSNTDNQCTDKQSAGLDFTDLDDGSVGNYAGFQWSGFTCQSSFNKRDHLGKRTAVSSKCVSGHASTQKSSSPSFGCDSKSGVDKTSVGEFHVYPEFDCDLEFHYDMPDGSTCKHRSACSSSGTVVKNSQCGGAKNVTIVYPSQPAIPKETCSFAVPSISFSCGSASSTKVYSTKITSSTSKPATFTTSSKAESTHTYSVSKPVESTSSTHASSTTSPVTATAGSSSSYSQITPTTTSSAVVSSSTSKVDSIATVPSASSATEVTTFTSVTSYLSTSTVLSTRVSTIISCAPEVTNCPASSGAVVTTEIIEVSTTICPVTETQTFTSSKPVETKPTTAVGTTVETSSNAAETKPSSAVGSTTIVKGSSTVVVSSSTSPSAPVETLPCPAVVPSCLNTWLFAVGCKDNSDASCYCPDSQFVENVFTCIYAHGESDEEISEAVNYFQGICGNYAGSNPGIATAVPTYVSQVSPASSASASIYTTIVVDVTTVVPCTTSVGSTVSTIAGSSSTIIISTAVTVPQVVFSSITSGASTTDVAVVPGTYSAVPVVSATPTGATATGNSPVTGSAPYPTNVGSTLITAQPTGTGAVYPTKSASTTGVFATAGAARIGSGIGFLGFLGLAVAAL
ncbi:hypothetical protein BKA67DRAFT_630320 [Truncatella angustata]|uniref:CFEM domain-containing protein n=1 Tax=Truncatella angustata TaxID=152316 RepID=A0A9P8RMK2_9PEZI|nr:uncharacterized protein BKA67DRAFT_630320 [Truncatella angustata]KAH6646963.1 hypothetical protein BKA67DRAFT_630320 [Truncatella angustata]